MECIDPLKDRIVGGKQVKRMAKHHKQYTEGLHEIYLR